MRLRFAFVLLASFILLNPLTLAKTGDGSWIGGIPSAKKTVRSIPKKKRSLSMSRPAKESGPVRLNAKSVLIWDETSNQPVYQKNADLTVPIASITKLMTAIVVVDSQLDLNQEVTIGKSDIDFLRGSHSRLRTGTSMTRTELLRLALMSSENRAASCLGRTYPGGLNAFVARMNQKAQELGMHDSVFVDSTGLRAQNQSSPADLVKLVREASKYPIIRTFSTDVNHDFATGRGTLAYRNTNSLVRAGLWDIQISKTGFIKEAGHCLVMKATIASRPMILVIMNSAGNESRISDARKIKAYLERLPQNNSSLALSSNAQATGL